MTTTLYGDRPRADATAVTKHSLAFILDNRPHTSHLLHHREPPSQWRGLPSPKLPICAPRLGASASQRFQAHVSHCHATKRPRENPAGDKQRPRKRALSAEEKRLARQCTVDGCANYTIDRGLCFRHGGGKTCSLDGCERSAKARGLCWRHGGSIRCSVADCPRGAKSRGLCWSHGGGKRCARIECDQIVPKRRGTLCARHQVPCEQQLH